jgi:TolB protein
MKLLIFNLRLLILSFCIAWIAGCSSNFGNPAATSPISTSTASSTPGKIAFVHGSGKIDIYVMNIDGSEIQNLTKNLHFDENPFYSGEPAWSPDGKNIVFTSKTAFAQIYTMAADGSDLKQLTSGTTASYGPAWSPDGKHIAFISDRAGVLDDRGVAIPMVYLMNSDGSDQRQLTNSRDFVDAVSWYPGTNLISVSVAYTRYGLKTYLMDIDGKIQSQFPSFVIEGIPVWSPNGKQFVFTSTFRPDCSGIVIAEADGNNQSCLKIDKIFPPVSASGASWSPDGKYILFSSNLDGDFDLYKVKVDGSNLTQLTNLPGDEGSPVWVSVP